MICVFEPKTMPGGKSATGGAPSGRSGRVFGGAGAVMVPVLMVTVCSFVIEVELRLMS
jgi:hypothetical protein